MTLLWNLLIFVKIFDTIPHDTLLSLCFGVREVRFLIWSISINIMNQQSQYNTAHVNLLRYSKTILNGYDVQVTGTCVDNATHPDKGKKEVHITIEMNWG